MKLSLVVLAAGAEKGKTILISRSPFVIGRDPKCHLRPASIIISNRHCSLENRDGKAWIKDLSSTNGTLRNGQPVEQEQELKNGDRLQIGPLLFEVRLESGVSVDQTTPPPAPRPQPNLPPKVQDDEDIAAVLLSMGDDAAPASHHNPVDSAGIPVGGTEIRTPDLPPSGEQGESIKKEEKKPEKKKMESTSVAADELLKKYLRRPRKV